MEQYLQYQQLLSNNIAEQEGEAQGLKEQFETALSVTEGEKSNIERTTDAIGGLFMVKPSEALAKVTGRLAKQGFNKLKGGVKDLLKPKEGQTESETPQESTEITETSDIPTDFEIKFDDPFDVMNELPDLPGLSDSLPQSTRFLGRNAQQRLMEQDPEEHITDRVQENQQQQGQQQDNKDKANTTRQGLNINTVLIS